MAAAERPRQAPHHDCRHRRLKTKQSADDGALARPGALLGRVPGDTQWFDLKFLREEHFGHLRAINFSDRNSPEDMNELEKVALRRREPLLTPVAGWERPIPWGHERSGPLTIIEGDHRLSALAGTVVARRSCAIPVLVGLSPSLCHWHLPDVAEYQAIE